MSTVGSAVLLFPFQAFEMFPNSLAEIDELMHAEQARADCRFQTDESVSHINRDIEGTSTKY